MAVIITTTVSLDTQRDETQVIIHLKQGDFGTRALRFIPAAGGKPVDFTSVTSGHLKLKSKENEENVLELDGTLGDNYVDIVPTETMTKYAEEYACELALMNADKEPLTSATFTIIVHGTVYNGDTVEHTNKTVTAVYFDENGQLCVALADGTVIKADKWTHTHDNATAEAAGFMSAEDKATFDTITPYIDQGVKTTDTPTFAGIKIGDTVTIGSDGLATGLRFE